MAGERPDVVHLYTHNVGLLAGRLLREIPYVVTIDSTNAQSNLMHPAREPTRFSSWSTRAVRPFERRVYAQAHRVIANSAWCARSVREDYGIAAEKIEVVPMGVALPKLSRVGRGGRPLPRILFIGRTMERKGGYDLLEAHQRWLADRCELVLVTQDRVTPGRNVRVVDDIRPGDGRIGGLIAGSDLLVLPSRLDQWPNAVMEAMAYGVTPVVAAVGGMPEMVDNGRAGVVLPDRSLESIRDAVASLLDDPERRRRLGESARRRVEDYLDVRLTANRLFDQIRSAAEGLPN